MFAGSFAAVAVLAALAPFNMGGCSGASLNINSLVAGTQQLGKAAFADNESIEPALGQSVAVQVTNRYRLYRDPALNRYVTLVGRTVGLTSKRPDITYYFGVLDTDSVNAFSGPHGYVFITRGTLRRIKDESELAGVLGHEIGHICKQHGLAAVRNADLTQGAMKVAAGASKEVAQFSNASDVLGNIALNVGFSEPQEMEADAEGVQYAIGAGYDPNGYLHFLQRLLAEQGAGGKPFGTHPGLGDRVKAVAAAVDKSGVAGAGATLADRFAANVALK